MNSLFVLVAVATQHLSVAGKQQIYLARRAGSGAVAKDLAVVQFLQGAIAYHQQAQAERPLGVQRLLGIDVLGTQQRRAEFRDDAYAR